MKIGFSGFCMPGLKRVHGTQTGGRFQKVPQLVEGARPAPRPHPSRLGVTSKSKRRCEDLISQVAASSL